jgi:hypothetical protein
MGIQHAPKCGAKNKAGNPCGSPAMQNGRCRIHGGASLSGAASPTFKTGRHSKHLPTRMLAQYEATKNDPNILALNDEIAMYDARLNDVLLRVDSGESGHLWRELKATYKALQDANRRKEPALVQELMTDLGALITRGHSDYAAWSEIGRIIEARRKLVESERKRLVDMQQMMSAEQGMMLVAQIYEQVKLHVSDRATLNAIGMGLARLYGPKGDESLSRTERGGN